MTDQEVKELAAILVHEHGNAALEVAEDRRSLHESGSDGFRVWTRIATAGGHPLRVREPAWKGGGGRAPLAQPGIGCPRQLLPRRPACVQPRGGLPANLGPAAA